MPSSRLETLRRKELASTLVWVAWALAVVITAFSNVEVFLLYALAWVLTAIWVGVDAGLRDMNRLGWTLLTLVTGPLGFLLYYLSRQPAPVVCSHCGAAKPNDPHPCPVCGHAALAVRAYVAIGRLYEALGNSLVRAPAEQAKETAKNISFALAAAVVVGLLLLNSYMPHESLRSLIYVIWVISAAAYWVIIAWWVYLDSAWRKMDGVPWAALTLATNVVGLVTYLVIRHPDPRVCADCGASVPTGHKYCPFCGSEAELMCPHCQATVKPGWRFCAVCAARLTPGDEPTMRREAGNSGITITGSVLDALEGTPIVGARVEIDARSEAVCVFTDSLGKFRIAGLDQRPYVLAASAEGYLPQAKAYSPGGSTRNVLFALYFR